MTCKGIIRHCRCQLWSAQSDKQTVCAYDCNSHDPVFSTPGFLCSHKNAGRHSESEAHEAEYAENDANDPDQSRPVFTFDTACMF